VAHSLLEGQTIGFIGAGHMAEAIARALLGSGVSAGQLLCADPDEARRRVFREELGIGSAANEEVAGKVDILVLAVKPQVLDEVVGGLAGALRGEALVVSIAAGVDTGRIEAGLGADARVVRVMPNTPMAVGRGVAAVARGARATDEDVARTSAIFAAGGIADEVPEERMHAVTAVSGSGPAYVFRFVEALAAAGVEAGLPVDQAERFARETVIGAARMLSETDEAVAELREQVTSPGGTTAAALARLDAAAFERILTSAVHAAVKRSRDLAAE